MKMRKGFTLVELLIVIVIIGILAAAMLLSSGSATASAEASNIVNNLRSLKSASVMFYADSMDAVAAASGGLPAGVDIANLKDYTDNPKNFESGKGYLFAATGNKWYVGVILDGTGAVKMSSTASDVLKKLEGKVQSLALFGTAGSTAPAAGATPGIGSGSKVVWMAAR